MIDKNSEVQFIILAHFLNSQIPSRLEPTLPSPNLRPAFGQANSQEIANRLYRQTHTTPFRNRGSNSGKRTK